MVDNFVTRMGQTAIDLDRYLWCGHSLLMGKRRDEYRVKRRQENKST